MIFKINFIFYLSCLIVNFHTGLTYPNYDTGGEKNIADANEPPDPSKLTFPVDYLLFSYRLSANMKRLSNHWKSKETMKHIRKEMYLIWSNKRATDTMMYILSEFKQTLENKNAQNAILTVIQTTSSILQRITIRNFVYLLNYYKSLKARPALLKAYGGFVQEVATILSDPPSKKLLFALLSMQIKKGKDQKQIAENTLIAPPKEDINNNQPEESSQDIARKENTIEGTLENTNLTNGEEDKTLALSDVNSENSDDATIAAENSDHDSLTPTDNDSLDGTIGDMMFEMNSDDENTLTKTSSTDSSGTKHAEEVTPIDKLDSDMTTSQKTDTEDDPQKNQINEEPIDDTVNTTSSEGNAKSKQDDASEHENVLEKVRKDEAEEILSHEKHENLPLEKDFVTNEETNVSKEVPILEDEIDVKVDAENELQEEKNLESHPDPEFKEDIKEKEIAITTSPDVSKNISDNGEISDIEIGAEKNSEKITPSKDEPLKKTKIDKTQSTNNIGDMIEDEKSAAKVQNQSEENILIDGSAKDSPGDEEMGAVMITALGETLQSNEKDLEGIQDSIKTNSSDGVDIIAEAEEYTESKENISSHHPNTASNLLDENAHEITPDNENQTEPQPKISLDEDERVDHEILAQEENVKTKEEDTFIETDITSENEMAGKKLSKNKKQTVINKDNQEKLTTDEFSDKTKQDEVTTLSDAPGDEQNLPAVEHLDALETINDSDMSKEIVESDKDVIHESNTFEEKDPNQSTKNLIENEAEKSEKALPVSGEEQNGMTDTKLGENEKSTVTNKDNLEKLTTDDSLDETKPNEATTLPDTPEEEENLPAIEHLNSLETIIGSDLSKEIVENDKDVIHESNTLEEKDPNQNTKNLTENEAEKSEKALHVSGDEQNEMTDKNLGENNNPTIDNQEKSTSGESLDETKQDKATTLPDASGDEQNLPAIEHLDALETIIDSDMGKEIVESDKDVIPESNTLEEKDPNESTDCLIENEAEKSEKALPVSGEEQNEMTDKKLSKNKKSTIDNQEKLTTDVSLDEIKLDEPTTLPDAQGDEQNLPAMEHETETSEKTLSVSGEEHNEMTDKKLGKNKNHTIDNQEKLTPGESLDESKQDKATTLPDAEGDEQNLPAIEHLDALETIIDSDIGKEIVESDKDVIPELNTLEEKDPNESTESLIENEAEKSAKALPVSGEEQNEMTDKKLDKNKNPTIDNQENLTAGESFDETKHDKVTTLPDGPGDEQNLPAIEHLNSLETIIDSDLSKEILTSDKDIIQESNTLEEKDPNESTESLITNEVKKSEKALSVSGEEESMASKAEVLHDKGTNKEPLKHEDTNDDNKEEVIFASTEHSSKVDEDLPEVKDKESNQAKVHDREKSDTAAVVNSNDINADQAESEETESEEEEDEEILEIMKIGLTDEKKKKIMTTENIEDQEEEEEEDDDDSGLEDEDPAVVSFEEGIVDVDSVETELHTTSVEILTSEEKHTSIENSEKGIHSEVLGLETIEPEEKNTRKEIIGKPNHVADNLERQTENESGKTDVKTVERKAETLMAKINSLEDTRESKTNANQKEFDNSVGLSEDNHTENSELETVHLKRTDDDSTVHDPNDSKIEYNTSTEVKLSKKDAESTEDINSPEKPDQDKFKNNDKISRATSSENEDHKPDTIKNEEEVMTMRILEKDVQIQDLNSPQEECGVSTQIEDSLSERTKKSENDSTMRQKKPTDDVNAGKHEKEETQNMSPEHSTLVETSNSDYDKNNNEDLVNNGQEIINQENSTIKNSEDKVVSKDLKGKLESSNDLIKIEDKSIEMNSDLLDKEDSKSDILKNIGQKHSNSIEINDEEKLLGNGNRESIVETVEVEQEVGTIKDLEDATHSGSPNLDKTEHDNGKIDESSPDNLSSSNTEKISHDAEFSSEKSQNTNMEQTHSVGKNAEDGPTDFDNNVKEIRSQKNKSEKDDDELKNIEESTSVQNVVEKVEKHSSENVDLEGEDDDGNTENTQAVQDVERSEEDVGAPVNQKDMNVNKSTEFKENKVEKEALDNIPHSNAENKEGKDESTAQKDLNPEKIVHIEESVIGKSDSTHISAEENINTSDVTKSDGNDDEIKFEEEKVKIDDTKVVESEKHTVIQNSDGEIEHGTENVDVLGTEHDVSPKNVKSIEKVDLEDIKGNVNTSLNENDKEIIENVKSKSIEIEKVSEDGPANIVEGTEVEDEKGHEEKMDHDSVEKNVENSAHTNSDTDIQEIESKNHQKISAKDVEVTNPEEPTLISNSDDKDEDYKVTKVDLDEKSNIVSENSNHVETINGEDEKDQTHSSTDKIRGDETDDVTRDLGDSAHTRSHDVGEESHDSTKADMLKQKDSKSPKQEEILKEIKSPESTLQDIDADETSLSEKTMHSNSNRNVKKIELESVDEENVTTKEAEESSFIDNLDEEMTEHQKENSHKTLKIIESDTEKEPPQNELIDSLEKTLPTELISENTHHSKTEDSKIEDEGDNATIKKEEETNTEKIQEIKENDMKTENLSTQLKETTATESKHLNNEKDLETEKSGSEITGNDNPLGKEGIEKVEKNVEASASEDGIPDSENVVCPIPTSVDSADSNAVISKTENVASPTKDFLGIKSFFGSIGRKLRKS